MGEKSTGKTILIIEDEKDIRNFACRVMQLEGHNCLQAETYNEFLRLVNVNKVNLIILDLRLAEDDGWIILKHLKSTPDMSVIPVIVCTASFAEPQKKRALKMGAADYLIKPLSATTLRNAVATALLPEK